VPESYAAIATEFGRLEEVAVRIHLYLKLVGDPRMAAHMVGMTCLLLPGRGSKWRSVSRPGWAPVLLSARPIW
jgi:hypothetical protein